jgi:hypothetical protein
MLIRSTFRNGSHHHLQIRTTIVLCLTKQQPPQTHRAYNLLGIVLQSSDPLRSPPRVGESAPRRGGSDPRRAELGEELLADLAPEMRAP